MKRGSCPDGGGEVHFQCPVIKSLKPINLTEEGKVRMLATKVHLHLCHAHLWSSRIVPWWLRTFIAQLLMRVGVWRRALSSSPRTSSSLVVGDSCQRVQSEGADWREGRGRQVRRVRGIAYACKVSPQIPNRLVDAAKHILNCVLPDTYIYTDHFRGPKAVSSPPSTSLP